MRLLHHLAVFAVAALLASSAFSQDRPDLMDVQLGEDLVTTMGAPAPRVINDNGKGQPLAGADNHLAGGSIDDSEAYVSNTLAGTVPATANGGTIVNLTWYTQEFDKASHDEKKVSVDQQAELAFSARILTPAGDTAETTMGADLEWFNDEDGGGVDDCSAKFSAQGAPSTAVPAPLPTKAKWAAKCKKTSWASVLTAIGVPTANQTTILTGLGLDGGDRVSVKGAF